MCHFDDNTEIGKHRNWPFLCDANPQFLFRLEGKLTWPVLFKDLRAQKSPALVSGYLPDFLKS